MAKIRYRDPQTESYRAVQHKVIEERGYFPNLYRMLLHSEEISLGWLNLMTAVRNKNSIDPLLREIIILRVAILNRALYEYESHLPIARSLGITDNQLNHILGTENESIDQKTKLIIEYTNAMTSEIQVQESIVKRLKDFFSDREILEITVTIASYNMVSRVLEALDIDHDTKI